MRTTKIILSILYITFLMSNNIFSQKENKFNISIRQLILPVNIDIKNSNSDCLFKMTNNYLEVYSKIWKYNSNTRNNELVYKKRIKAKVSDEDYKKIKLISKKLLLLDSSYSEPIIDGYMWIIDYSIDNVSRKIKLDNYSLKETNELFSIINKYTKKEKYYLFIK